MEDHIPLSAYELEKQVDGNGEAIEKFEKRISDLEKSNVNLGWRLGELDTQIAEIRAKRHTDTQKAEVTIAGGMEALRGIAMEWIEVFRKAEKDHGGVDLDHKDCGELAGILNRVLEITYKRS